MLRSAGLHVCWVVLLEKKEQKRWNMNQLLVVLIDIGCHLGVISFGCHLRLSFAKFADLDLEYCFFVYWKTWKNCVLEGRP